MSPTLQPTLAFTLDNNNNNNNNNDTNDTLLYNYPNVTDAARTPSNDTDDERNESLAVLEVAISASILVLAVCGNGIVVVSLGAKRGKLSRMHLMMLHLSLADLSVAFFQVLPQMVWDITFRFQGGAFLCVAVKYLQLVTMYGSAYVLLSTAVDRYVAICRPFLSHKWTSRQAHLLVLAAWVASLLFSLPQVFIFRLREVGEGSGVYDCWATFHPEWMLQLYVTWNVLSVFIVPTLALVVLYGLICHAVWRSSKMVESQAHKYIPKTPQSQDTHQQSSHKAGNDTNRKSRPWRNNNSSPTTTPATNCRQANAAHKGQCTPMSTRATTTHPDTGHQYSHAGLQDNEGGGQHEDIPDSARFYRNKRQSETGTPPRLSSASNDVSVASRLISGSGSGSGHVKSRSGARATMTRGGVSGGISRAKMKTIKLTLTVVICYLLCWTPYYVAQLWAAYDENAPFQNIFFTLVLLLASVNSCTNPWIYMAFSDTILNSLKFIALSVLCCCQATRRPALGGKRAATASSVVYSSCQSKSKSTNGVSRL